MTTIRVGWSITHQEFTITDYYYFSILQKEAERAGIVIEEISDWSSLEKYDTLVFNYPEKPFTEAEGRWIEKLVWERGKKVILLGYYTSGLLQERGPHRRYLQLPR